MSTFVDSSAVVYTGPEFRDILVQTFADSVTMVNCRVLDGVKQKAKIGGLSSERVLGTPGCDFTEVGDTTYSNKAIETVPLGPSQKLCEADLEGVALELDLKPGSNNEDFMKPELKDKLVSLYQGQMSEEIELLLWQGNTGGAPGTLLDLMDGFNAWINASVTVNKVLLPVAITAANVQSEMGRLIAAIPNKLKSKRRMSDWVILVSTNVYSALEEALSALSGNTIVNVSDAANFEVFRIFRGYRVEERYGMSDDTMVYCNQKKDLIIGTDLEDDKNELNFLPQKMVGGRSMLITGYFKLGTQIGRDVDITSYGI